MLIKCEKLIVGYNNTPVTDEINFEVDTGDYLCVIGENGAGKSTLIKTLLGLQKPISGNLIFGDDLSSTDIGYLPQQSDVQRSFPASVYEVVISGNLNKCGLRPFYNKQEKERTVQVLEQLSIYDLRKCCYGELSGGQQQRVLLARALCATNKILLLDEPVTGLDPVATQELYTLLSDLNKDKRIAIVMITHNVDDSLQYATHVLHLSKQHNIFTTVDRYKEVISQ